MRLFGLSLTRASALPAEEKSVTLSPIDHRSGWWGLIRESFTGAWQRNVEVNHDAVLTYFAVFACISLISSDIAKLAVELKALDPSGVWVPTTSPSFSPVLKKPNRYQNRIKFIEQWVISKLSYGNTYVLKERDGRGVVIALYVLSPPRVTPLVAPDGSVYYSIQGDTLAGIPSEGWVVPASEIIHDMYCPMYHPLVGLSPIVACGLAATQGLSIQNNSTTFFTNQSRPSGIITAPGAIKQSFADKIKADWSTNHSGLNFGSVAVLSDGLSYKPLSMSATDSQLIDQLKWTAANVCSVFHVPAYKIGVGEVPAAKNTEALDQQYYSQCLQSLIEDIELLLDEGLALPDAYTVEMNLSGLLRMDTASRFETWGKGLKDGWVKPNEIRAREGMLPVKGGDTPYMQQQNFPLELLADLSRTTDSAKPAPAPAAEAAASAEDEELAFTMIFEKEFQEAGQYDCA